MLQFSVRLAAPILIAATIGCGGGALSQDDMRRHALRRPSEKENTEEKHAAKNVAAKQNTAAKPVPDSKQPSRHNPPVAQKKADNSKPTATAPAIVKRGPLPPTPEHQAPTPQKPTGGDDEQISPADLQPPPVKQPTQPLTLTERRQQTIDNLTKIGEALRRYSDEQGKLVGQAICNAQGEPMLSWRVELLPYLGYQDLYSKFDPEEPWDSARNKPLLKLIPPEFQSPERFDEKTNFLLPVASFTPFAKTRGVGTRKIEDGLKNTIILLEVDEPSAVPWTQPKEFALNINTFQYQVGSLREDGFFAVWGDGTVSRITPESSTADLKAAFSFDGGDSFASHLVKATPNAVPEISSDTIDPETPNKAAVAKTGSADAKTNTVAAQGNRRPIHNAPGARQPGSTQKTPVPDVKNLNRARTLVAEIYENDYRAARSQRDQQALAKKMLKGVADLEDDPAGQYMTLDIAIQIATRSGDSQTAISALEEMLGRFDVDAREQLDLEHRILQQLAKRKDRGRGVSQTLLDEAEGLIDTAIRAEEFDTAESLCKIALGAARQLQQQKEIANLDRKMRVIKEARNAYRAIHRTIAAFEDADDPKANLDGGRYYCLVRGEWEKGLPMLARGSHRRFKELANAELSEPIQLDAQLQLADGWWQAAKDESAYRKALQLRAAYWYMRALERLPQGLLRVKAELRIEQVEKDYGDEAVAALD